MRLDDYRQWHFYIKDDLMVWLDMLFSRVASSCMLKHFFSYVLKRHCHKYFAIFFKNISQCKLHKILLKREKYQVICFKRQQNSSYQTQVISDSVAKPMEKLLKIGQFLQVAVRFYPCDPQLLGQFRMLSVHQDEQANAYPTVVQGSGGGGGDCCNPSPGFLRRYNIWEIFYFY